MLVVEGPSTRLLRREPDGSLVTHADLRGSARASAEGGEALEAVELDRGGFSCALGGPDGRSLFVLAAEFHGFETMAEDIAARTGQLLVVHGRVPRAGRP